MKPEIYDVDRTLEYSQSHDQMARALPIVLIGLLLGLFVLTPLDGSSVRSRDIVFATIIVAFTLVCLGAMAYRRAQPSVSSIVLSREGILFRDFSERIIPWGEITNVRIDKVSGSRDLFSTRVTAIEIPRSLHVALAQGRWSDSVIAWEGDPSLVYISYFHSVPTEELHRAVLLRWHAFSRHARGLTLPLHIAEDAARYRDAPAPATARGYGRSVVSRVPRYELLSTIAALFRGGSLAGRLTSLAAIAGVVALLANHAGLWSTAGQQRARVSAAEAKAWRLQMDAETKAREEERRRFDERMRRAFQCMEWSARNDPECRPEKR
jgi:hypothetical protein